MKFLTTLALALGLASPAMGSSFYSNIADLDGSTATMRISGLIHVAASTAAPLAEKITLDGTVGEIRAGSATITGTGSFGGDVTANGISVADLDSSTQSNANRITTNEFAISALRVSTGSLQSQIDSNDSELAAVGVSTNNLQNQINGNDGELDALRVSTGALHVSTQALEASKLDRAGDTMTGTLTMSGASSYINSGSSVNASAFFGDGSGLTNLPSGGHSIATGSAVGAAGSSFTQRSTLTFNSNYFSLSDDSAGDATFVSVTTGTSNDVWQVIETLSDSALTTQDFSTTLTPGETYKIILRGVKATTGLVGVTFNSDVSAANTNQYWDGEGSGDVSSSGNGNAATVSNTTVTGGESLFAEYTFSTDPDDNTIIRGIHQSQQVGGGSNQAIASGFYTDKAAALSSAGIYVSAGTLNGTATLFALDSIRTLVPNPPFDGQCPSGFTKITANDRALGCMQTAEEGSAAWATAHDDCFDTYGGRLPTDSEDFIAKNNYTLTDETDDNEWLADGAPIAAVTDGIYRASGSIANTNSTNKSTSFAYRCWIPAASLLVK